MTLMLKYSNRYTCRYR